MGRVTVVKSLAVSKLIHLFSIVDDLAPEFVKQIHDMFQEFVWNGKKSRIKYNYGVNLIEDGGLGLPDIRIISMALKCTWIKRSFSTGTGWQRLFELQYDNPKYIWSLDPKSLKILSVNTENMFWKKVFLEWAVFTDKYMDESANILKSYSIWNSYYVKHKPICLLKKRLCQRGVFTVGNLFHNNEFYSLREFNDTFNAAINFLDFESLKACIPKHWVRIITSGTIPDPVTYISMVDKIIQTAKLCKFINSYILSRSKNHRTVHETKWEVCLGLTFPRETWSLLYILPKRVTINSTLISFQFKISHRLLITNKTLKLWNIKLNDDCSFCHDHVETIDHLLADCVHTHSLWQALAHWLQPELDIREILIKKNILLGYMGGQDSDILINKLILLTKRFIYVQRCFEKQLYLAQLLAFLCLQMKVEVKVSDKLLLDHHFKIWGPISQKLLSINN